ncbi:hypothetical protein SDC9_212545 [bioreactor metagenome]|uniref:Uncharacterized protein n=1 Tax=bioreactor metagenome TaxID=1076179 RepID=A0A645JM94_9ZZZZ
MLAVIQVADHRHNCADLAILSRGRACEDRQEGISREVARTANAVHHAASQHVRAVHVAADIDLDCCIDRDDADTPDNFRAVGNLLRAKQQA